MTVCIGAIAGPITQRRVVAVSDLMLSSDVVSFDTQTLKCEPVTDDGKWIMMYAGSPSVSNAVYRSAEAMIRSTDESAMSVQTAFETAFREELKRKIEGEILGPFGLTREIFVRRGRKYLGLEKFTTLLDEVRSAALETDFLIAGFDPNGWHHLFSVTDPGIIERHNNIRFHAIGTGSVMAESALCATYDPSLGHVALAYRLCEAKFLAEAGSGVGRKTFVDVVAPDGSHEILAPEHVEEVREIWRANQPPMPPEALAKIQERLYSPPWASAQNPPTSE